MTHQFGGFLPARRPGSLRRRFGRRSALAARAVPRVLRRPVTVALLRSIESRTTHYERFGAPQIKIAVNLVKNAPTNFGNELSAPVVRRSTPGHGTGEQRPDRLVRRSGADARDHRWPTAHRRSSLVVVAAPVELSGSAAGTLRGRGAHRGVIDAPAARTIALSATAPRDANPRPSVADRRSADSDRRLSDTDAGTSPPAPLDLERLTDKVVAAIDRRLWSHRERMGGR